MEGVAPRTPMDMGRKLMMMMNLSSKISENIDNIYSLLLKAQEDARKEGENVESMTDTRVFQTIVDIFSGIEEEIDSLMNEITYPPDLE